MFAGALLGEGTLCRVTTPTILLETKQGEVSIPANVISSLYFEPRMLGALNVRLYTTKGSIFEGKLLSSYIKVQFPEGITSQGNEIDCRDLSYIEAVEIANEGKNTLGASHDVNKNTLAQGIKTANQSMSDSILDFRTRSGFLHRSRKRQADLELQQLRKADDGSSRFIQELLDQEIVKLSKQQRIQFENERIQRRLRELKGGT